MNTSTNTLSMRKQEAHRIGQRMAKTAERIDALTETLFLGRGEMSASEYDALMAEYHTALRRYELDEMYLEKLKSKAKLSDEERERTTRKDYRRNYNY